MDEKNEISDFTTVGIRAQANDFRTFFRKPISCRQFFQTTIFSNKIAEWLGTLPKREVPNINFQKVWNLGISKNFFLKHYPEICKLTGHAKLLKNWRIGRFWWSLPLFSSWASGFRHFSLALPPWVRSSMWDSLLLRPLLKRYNFLPLWCRPQQSEFLTRGTTTWRSRGKYRKRYRMISPWKLVFITVTKVTFSLQLFFIFFIFLRIKLFP